MNGFALPAMPRLGQMPIQCLPPQMGNNMMFILPPLVQKPSDSSDNSKQSDSASQSPSEPGDKNDLKERNRIAAHKWRQKKDHYLLELESSNDSLRKETLDLSNQVLSLKVQNHVLEAELRFFQQFMSKIVSVPSN